MPDRVFLDTNILVHLANVDSLQNVPLTSLFDDLRKTFELWISRQVLREYAVVMTRPGLIEKPITQRQLISDIEKWETLFHVADETEEVTGNLKRLLSRYTLQGKRIHDANIVATAMAYSIPVLFTLNREDFKGFREIQLMQLTY